MQKALPERIVNAIRQDILDRVEIGDYFEAIDIDVWEEIRSTWMGLIQSEIDIETEGE